MSIVLFVLAGWLTVGAINTVRSIGKPRKPLTADAAAFAVVILAVVIVIIVLAGLRIGGMA